MRFNAVLGLLISAVTAAPPNPVTGQSSVDLADRPDWQRFNAHITWNPNVYTLDRGQEIQNKITLCFKEFLQSSGLSTLAKTKWEGFRIDLEQKDTLAGDVMIIEFPAEPKVQVEQLSLFEEWIKDLPDGPDGVPLQVVSKCTITADGPPKLPLPTKYTVTFVYKEGFDLANLAGSLRRTYPDVYLKAHMGENRDKREWVWNLTFLVPTRDRKVIGEILDKEGISELKCSPAIEGLCDPPQST